MISRTSTASYLSSSRESRACTPSVCGLRFGDLCQPCRTTGLRRLWDDGLRRRRVRHRRRPRPRVQHSARNSISTWMVAGPARQAQECEGKGHHLASDQAWTHLEDCRRGVQEREGRWQGASSRRANARKTCENRDKTQWRSVIDVDLIGIADSPEKAVTKTVTLSCGA